MRLIVLALGETGVRIDGAAEVRLIDKNGCPNAGNFFDWSFWNGYGRNGKSLPEESLVEEDSEDESAEG